jgi:hypothetical protein
VTDALTRLSGRRPWPQRILFALLFIPLTVGTGYLAVFVIGYGTLSTLAIGLPLVIVAGVGLLRIKPRSDVSLPELRRMTYPPYESIVRMTAISQLGERIDDGESEADVIASALDDDSPHVRATALVVVDRHRIASLRKAAVRALQDPARFVRARAGNALIRIGDESALESLETAAERETGPARLMQRFRSRLLRARLQRRDAP